MKTKFTPEELSAYSEKLNNALRNFNASIEEIDGIIEEIYEHIGFSRSISDDAVIGEYESYRGTINNFSVFIQDYAEFLALTALKYQENEDNSSMMKSFSP